MDVRKLVEVELQRRGLDFAVDLRSRRLVVVTARGNLVISLGSLERMLAFDPDPRSIVWWLDAALAPDVPFSRDGLVWLLEPNDFEQAADFRAPISPQVDRVLAHAAPDGSRLTWMRPSDLDALGIDLTTASADAYANLDRALREAQVETHDGWGATVLIIGTAFPSKASLLLAPSLRDVTTPCIGWPLLAVAPARDFLLLWNASRENVIANVSTVTVREHARAPYPLSAEVFQIDEDIRAIGRFGGGSDK